MPIRFAGLGAAMSEERDDVGYGRPPLPTRFQKGRSGNPNGRPKGRHNRPPYDAVLGRSVTIKEDGVERQVTAEQAFLLKLTSRGLDGDTGAARFVATAIEEARLNRPQAETGPRLLPVQLVTPGSVNTALEPLRMAAKLDRYRFSAKMMIEPWLVEKALSRLGDRQLTPDQQATVVRAVRTPDKVRWPSWWKIRE